MCASRRKLFERERQLYEVKEGKDLSLLKAPWMLPTADVPQYGLGYLLFLLLPVHSERIWAPHSSLFLFKKKSDSETLFSQAPYSKTLKILSSLLHFFGSSYSKQSYNHPTINFIFLVCRDFIRNKHPVCYLCSLTRKSERQEVGATGGLAGDSRGAGGVGWGPSSQKSGMGDSQDKAVFFPLHVCVPWNILSPSPLMPVLPSPSVFTHLLSVLLGDVFLG